LIRISQLIWQIGDRHYNAKRWSEAADWFLTGSHEVFGSISHVGNSKCHRKAALCHIQQREYARAASIIRRCPVNEATTHYVVLYSAVHQGLFAFALNQYRVDSVLASKGLEDEGLSHWYQTGLLT
jgi:hypothetical protein